MNQILTQQQLDDLAGGANPARNLARGANIALPIFLALHVPLALVLRQSDLAATIHALLTLGVGLLLASDARRPQRAVYAGAYIAGAEVLWRMTGADVFWEFGKYALITVFGFAMLRRARLRGPLLPLVYFGLLLPSTAITIGELNPALAREMISFNLSGPLALLVAAWFCHHLRLSRAHLRMVSLAFLGPVIGIATVAMVSTLTAERITFTGEANFVTSGGFGPNQVSSMLGLGALLGILAVVGQRGRADARLLWLGLAVTLAAQSALTLSRGGLYAAGGSLLIAALLLARSARARLNLLVVGGVLAVIAAYVVVPGLDAFSDGALTRRFRETTTTNRDVILRSELRLWQQNPLLGVGPGGSSLARLAEERDDARVAAHTEFSRLLAEHGIFGLFAMLALLVAGIRNMQRAGAGEPRALKAAFVSWCLLFMFGNAMRIVAPSLLFGLSFATIVEDEEQ